MVDASNAPTLGGASDTRGPQPSTSGLAQRGPTDSQFGGLDIPVPPNFIERLTAREVPACTDRRPQQITAEQLSEAPRPVKRLRRDSASAAAAKELLKEIGYVASKGNCASDKNIEASWPEDYIDRLDGSEPTYESLSLSEFIAGYLSIMEESVPICQQTQPIIRHIHYLRGLMEDCFETDWQTVRTAHKQVLHAIEHLLTSRFSMPLSMVGCLGRTPGLVLIRRQMLFRGYCVLSVRILSKIPNNPIMLLTHVLSFSLLVVIYLQNMPPRVLPIPTAVPTACGGSTTVPHTPK